MCHYYPWEDDSPQSDDHEPRTGNGNDPIEIWETRLDMLEARVARIEARVEVLQARMLFLQRALRIACVLFMATFAYAMSK